MTRSNKLLVRGRTLQLPCFFSSISSVKTNLRPVDYLDVLVSLRFPSYLISAYDIVHAPQEERVRIYELVELAAERGMVGLLDSGNYESFWLRDSVWTPKVLSSVLAQTKIPLGFCFDQQNPPDTREGIVTEVVEVVLRDQAQTVHATILPIVHAPVALLPSAVAEVVRQLQPIMVAVPERELGEGLLVRAETVSRIRSDIAKYGNHTALHLLGTGNPRSILLYALCGADSFDGLEWCQSVADPTSANLHHFQQREILDGEFAANLIEGLDYVSATLVHNLVFFQDWMRRVSEAVHSDPDAKLLEACFSQAFVKKLRKRLPELFA